MASGVDAQGHPRFAAFTGVSRRLGGCYAGGTAHGAKAKAPLSQRELREVRISAMNKRQRLSALCAGSGQRLGTASSAVTSTTGIPVCAEFCGGKRVCDRSDEPAALAGVDGRISSGQSRANSSADNHDPDLDTTGVLWRCVVCSHWNEEVGTGAVCKHCPPSTSTSSTSVPHVKSIATAGALRRRQVEWVCTQCTLINSYSAVVCGACDSPSPIPIRL